MKYMELIEILEEIAPTEAFRDTDNSGEQIYTGNENVERVLVCLEVNSDVIKEAAAKGADMIITHHPLIFHPQSFISYDDFPGRYIHEAIKKGINVYSSHLSFDFAPRGNNVFIAELLGLRMAEESSPENGYEGVFDRPMTFLQVCRHVEKYLDLPPNYIRCVDAGREQIIRVGYCTGAGGDYIYRAAAAGCDLFITGDLRLHEAQYAKAMGMSVIDAGHYGTEKIFSENMADQLRSKISDRGLDIDVIIAEANTNPYVI